MGRRAGHGRGLGAVTTGQSPPLGRFSPTDDDGEQHHVVLQGLPVRLLIESREHRDELLREFAIVALSTTPPKSHVPAAFLELVEVLGVRYAAATARPDAQIDDARSAGLAMIDLTYVVPASAVAAADELERWLALADDYCVQERLLTLPRSPLQQQYFAWYLGEFRRQISGGAPLPWSGPLASSP